MKNRALSLFLFLALAFLVDLAQAGTDVYYTSGTWTAPAGVTQVTVEVWGGGGAGGGQDMASDGGGGGGGGAYSKAVGITVVPGNTYSFTVGAGGVGVAGGTGGAGGDSYFINTSTVLAEGGSGGSPSTGSPPAGGAGGSAAAGVGSTKYSGGAGGRGRNSSTGQGGPGGSSAGTAADGTSGANTWSTVTAAAAPTGGGIGGNGGGVGSNGFAPASGNGGGGGGSGEGTSRSGGNGAGGKIAITYFPCVPPSNIPAGVALSCVCDTFGRTNLNPSTIFGGNWSVSNSDGISNPYINSTTGFLRLTENTSNNAKAATVPSIFPAAGNFISVEFSHYSYNGSGADGIVMTLSDYSIPAVPGAFGGSLGYAQKSNPGSDCTKAGGCPGFAGGWVGVGLDEYGNYSAAAEGRVLGPGASAQSVGLRGPGSGQSGYRWMTGALGVGGIDSRASTTPAPGYMYQVVVDARSYATGNVNIQINRDTTNKDGTSYTNLLPSYNAYAEASYALAQGWISKLVPDYWKISFTGSTGGSANIHEIGNLRICAQTVLPPTGGNASGFSAIDEAYPGAPTVPAYQNFQTGDIYMKLAGVPFSLWVGALTDTPAPGLAVGYSATSTKYVQVKLVNNSDGLCGTSASRSCNAACTNKAAVESGTGATQIATFPSGSTTGVASPNPTFTVNGAYKHLIAVMKECTTSACTAFTSTAPACSVGAFSVRPHALKLTTNASNTNTVGIPVFKAGSGAFTFNVEADTYNLSAAGSPQTLSVSTSYTGSPKVGVIDVSSPPMPAGGSWVAGTLSLGTSLAPAVSGVSNNSPTYSEVGLFKLAGTWPKTSGYAGGNDIAARGVYDGVRVVTECASLSLAQCDALKLATAWTGIDSVSTSNDCVQDSFSNLKTSGKYGCSFGIVSDQTFGRFIPDRFVAVSAGGGAACAAGGFSYMDQPFAAALTMTVEARNSSNVRTQNYAGTLANGVVGIQMENANSGTPIPVARLNVTNAPAWNAGSYSVVADRFLRDAAGPDGPYDALDIGLSVNDEPLLSPALRPYLMTRDMDASNTACMVDLTGLSTAAGVCTATRLVSATKLRYGRLRLQNANGSELLPLPLPLLLQFWSGAAQGWQINTLDTCTPILASDFAFNFPNQPPTQPTNQLAPCETRMQIGGAAPNYTATLSAPGANNAGWTNVSLNLGAAAAGSQCTVVGGAGGPATTVNAPWLQFNWTGAVGNPASRATFGVYRSGRVIHRREMYR